MLKFACVCLFLCLSAYVFSCMCVCLRMFVCVCLSANACVFICLRMFVCGYFLRLSVYVCVRLCVYVCWGWGGGWGSCFHFQAVICFSDVNKCELIKVFPFLFFFAEILHLCTHQLEYILTLQSASFIIHVLVKAVLSFTHLNHSFLSV